MPTWLLGWQGYAIGGVLIAIMAGAGTWYVTHGLDQKAYLALELKQSQAQTVSTTNALNQLKGFIGTMNVAANGYQSDKDAIDAKFNALAAQFRKAINGKPLPADCRPDPDRVRSLSAALAAANATTAGHSTGAAVPAHP